MLKKSLLSLAIAAGMGLAGCSGTDNTGTTGPNGGVIPVGGDGNTKVIYSPEQRLLPLQSDLLFASAAATDGTASTSDTTPPVTTAINDLDGWSTVSHIDIALDGSIDPASLNTDPASTTQNVFLIRAATDSVVQSLDIQQIADKAERQTLIFKAYAASGAYLQTLQAQIAGGADAATAEAVAIATAQGTAASKSVQIPPFAVSDSDFLVDLKTTILTNLAAINTGGPLNGSYAQFKAVFDSITLDGTLNGQNILLDEDGNLVDVGFEYAQYNVDNNGMSDDGAGLYSTLVDEFNLAATDPVAITGVSATLYDGDYRAEVISQDGGTNNTLRITPVTPLDPKTKYVVALVGGSNGIKDSSGAPILGSSSYNGLKKNYKTEPYDLPELRGLQKLVNNLEDITAGFAAATKNLSDEQKAQLESDIVLSYSFTTGGVDDVLLGMTIPNVALDQAIPGVAASTFAATFYNAIETQYRADNGISADADLTKNQQAALAALQAEFARDVKLYPEIRIEPATASLDQFLASRQAAIDAGLNSTALQDLLPKPSASENVGFWNTIEATSGTVSFPENMTVAPGKIYEGWIELPYYGYAPDGAESSTEGAAAIRASQWQADRVLGGALESALTGAPATGALPPADSDGSYNVTYNFPFAAKQTDEVVPVVVSYPGMSSVVDAGSGATLEQAILASAYTAISGDTNLSDALTSYLTAEAADPSQLDVKNALIAGDATGLLGAAVDGPYPTVIYNHGITDDRSNSLPLGNQLGAACYSADSATGLFSITGVPCYVTVSIDQPLHGASVQLDDTLAPVGSLTDVPGLTNVDFARVAGALPNSVPAELRERHFGYTVTDPATLAAGKLPNLFVSSGSMFINLTNFQNLRDNLRQQILDLSSLNASLSAVDTALQAYDASTEGFLTYTSPLAALGGTDRVTTHFVGHSLGGVNGIPFVASNNKSFGGAALQAGAVVGAGGDPARYLPNINPILGANFAMTGGGTPKLLENSANTSFGAPVLLTALSASGIEQGTSNYEKFLNVAQATLDSTDPINYMDNFKQGALSTATPGSLFFEIAGSWDVNGTYTVAPDQTIPNDADNRPLPPLDLTSIGFGVAEAAPLSGTEPLLRESGSNAALSDNLPLTGLGAQGDEGVYNSVAGFQAAGAALAADAGATSQSISVASRFNAGTHGTLVEVDNAAVFSEMVGQIATFFATSGRAVLVNDSSVLSNCDPSADAANPQCL